MELDANKMAKKSRRLSSGKWITVPPGTTSIRLTRENTVQVLRNPSVPSPRALAEYRRLQKLWQAADKRTEHTRAAMLRAHHDDLFSNASDKAEKAHREAVRKSRAIERRIEKLTERENRKLTGSVGASIWTMGDLTRHITKGR